jgi:hypothetical protein
MSHCQRNDQQNEIFQPKMFQKSKFFYTFADVVGKNAKPVFRYARARVFSARKDSEKSVYDKLYDQLSTQPVSIILDYHSNRIGTPS